MPFLASENVLIDPAQGKVILPSREKDDMALESHDQGGEDFGWDLAVIPLICSKLPTLPRVTPANLEWIAGLKEFEKTHDAGNITKTSSSGTSSKPSTLKEALRLNKNYLLLNEKYNYKFDDVFTNKLPDKLPSPDAPRHRIILEDEKMSVNGRMFRLPTRYWSLMQDFLNEHLAACRIRHSSSHITAGT